MTSCARSRNRSTFMWWWRDSSGGIAVMFAVLLPVLISAVGMSIDMAQAYLVRERLARALDAAALAVAGSGLESQAEIEARVDEFMKANYPANKIGAVIDFSVEVSGDDVTVSASAQLKTGFLWVIGVEEIDVSKSTRVRKQVKGVEAVLVLDNTGSMSTNNNIATLKQASINFVNTMFSKARSDSDIRIGIVPYSNTVRVGLYGMGQIPDPLTGASRGTYGDGTRFINDLPGTVTYRGRTGTSYNSTTRTYSFSTSNSDQQRNYWYGCVIEHNPDGWDVTVNTNDPYPTDVEDNYEGPWDIYQYSSYCFGKMEGSTCRTGASYNPKTHNILPSSTPNSGCPYANILPLTSNRQDILHTINAMQPHGNTMGNAGMIWGYRLISPEPPFDEAAPWDSQYWRKAVIMMTDGDNTKDTNYNYLWLTQRSRINVNDSGTPNVKGYNTRFEEVCDALKARDVLVYTVVFTSGVNEDTKGYYRRCATNESMYFYAPSQAELLDVFNQIARELSNLYITE